MWGPFHHKGGTVSPGITWAIHKCSVDKSFGLRGTVSPQWPGIDEPDPRLVAVAGVSLGGPFHHRGADGSVWRGDRSSPPSQKGGPFHHNGKHGLCLARRNILLHARRGTVSPHVQARAQEAARPGKGGGPFHHARGLPSGDCGCALGQDLDTAVPVSDLKAGIDGADLGQGQLDRLL